MILKSIADVDEKQLNEFTCGVVDLDRYLIRHARINDQNGYGKTFLLLENNDVIGFFTLSSASIEFEEFLVSVTNHLPKYPIPCIRIASLGVRGDKQGRGYGRELLKQAFIKVLSVASTIGVRLIVVDAKETSASFYEKFGFMKLQSNKLSYFIVLDTIIAAFKK